jgi:hypothetical protein
MIYLYLTSVHPTSVHLMGGCLIGVYLTGMCLLGVYVMGILACISCTRPESASILSRHLVDERFSACEEEKGLLMRSDRQNV